jgi:hypothetical protein
MMEGVVSACWRVGTEAADLRHQRARRLGQQRELGWHPEHSSISEPVRPGGGYDLFVEAMSRVLASLSRQIAADVLSVSSTASE